VDPRSSAPQGDELLVHGRFLRGLARALVTDDERAEDLVQDTWARALESPARHGAAPRAWLAQILRRVARTKGQREGERGSREDVAARERPAEDARDPGAILAEIELSRRVLEAVERLREPYRSTLYLRYWRGLAPQLIAAEQRAPVKTVKTRLARGLELLREELDRQHGGRRETWVALLLPLAAGPLPAPLEPEPFEHGPPAAAPSLALAPALTGAALLLAAAAAGGALWFTRDDARSPEPALAPLAPPATGSAPAIAAVPTPAARSAVSSALTAPASVPQRVRMRGRVLDPEGEPVPGAEVSATVLGPAFGRERRGPPGLRPGERGAAEPAAEARTTSDAAGAFELVLDRPGLSRLVIERDGHAPIGRKGLVFLGQDLDLGTFELEPGVTLAGRVLDEDGGPVAGAELWQERLDEGLSFGPGAVQPERVGVSGADGRFELRRQAVGEWRLEARSERHAPAQRSGTTQRAGERVADLELVLARGARVHGRVLGLEALERGRASVLARPQGEGEPGGRLRRATLDEQGAFELGGLEPGAEVELFVVLDGVELDEHEPRALAGSAQRVRAGGDANGDGEEVLLYVERAPGGRGREVDGAAPPEPGEAAASGAVDLRVLRPDGAPAAGALVALRTGPPGEGRRRAADDIRAVDATGRLRWSGLAPGTNEFRAVVGLFGLDGEAGDGWQAVQVEARGVAELSLESAAAAELRGSVRVADRALAGAELLLRPAAAGGGRGGEGPALVAQSDDAGRFDFRELAPGSYRIELFHPERVLPEVRALELPEGATELVLALGEARASGLVRDAAGRPLAGALVRALPAGEGAGAERGNAGGRFGRKEGRLTGPPRDAHTATTDVEGRFELPGLEPGRPVRLTATLAGFAQRAGAELVPEAFQELVLEPEARLALELDLGFRGDAESFYLLRARGPGGERRQHALASGRVLRLEALSPGTWTLELVAGSPRGPRSGGALAERTLELAQGANELRWQVP
jgi:RNA polymerase sigma factor (sigma-70 family)